MTEAEIRVQGLFRDAVENRLMDVLRDIELLGMGFQDYDWWPEYCALAKKMGVIPWPRD